MAAKRRCALRASLTASTYQQIQEQFYTKTNRRFRKHGRHAACASKSTKGREHTGPCMSSSCQVCAESSILSRNHHHRKSRQEDVPNDFLSVEPLKSRVKCINPPFFCYGRSEVPPLSSPQLGRCFGPKLLLLLTTAFTPTPSPCSCERPAC